MPKQGDIAHLQTTTTSLPTGVWPVRMATVALQAETSLYRQLYSRLGYFWHVQPGKTRLPTSGASTAKPPKVSAMRITGKAKTVLNFRAP
jgi:hypothetical protein